MRRSTASGLQAPARLEALSDIARAAGGAVMRVYAGDFSVRWKADRSPVTEADVDAHRIIAEGLESLDPGTPVLSEESAELAPYGERCGWDRYWLVDPLDGTKEFVKRNGQFTVNIALIERGRAVAGVVYAPARDWMYAGSEAAGAFKSVDGGAPVPIRCVPVPAAGPLRVVGSSSHASPSTRALVDGLRSLHSEVSFVQMGSSLKICLVAEGAADLYPRFAPTMEWDTAAAHAVLSAAGGRLVDHAAGTELRYNKEDLRNGWFLAEGSSGDASGTSAMTSPSVLSGLTLQGALQRILEEVRAETGTLHALGEDGLLHLMEHAGGVPEHLLAVIERIPVGKGMAGLAAERGEPVQICNLQTDDSGDARPGARATGMRGSICVPVRRAGRLAGVLGVAVRGEREFTPSEAEWLESAGAALAMER